MSAERPFVLSIAGFDPSGGAGVLADVKTFENLRTQGLAILTANTLQTEASFEWLDWQPAQKILQSITTLAGSYPIVAVKIGIMPSLMILSQFLELIKKLLPKAFIVWDPVIRSSTQHLFLSDWSPQLLDKVLANIDLITPNYIEATALIKTNAQQAALFMAQQTNVLLKGGHNPQELGTDYLFTNNKETFRMAPNQSLAYAKHGSGCVLSSAIAAYIALGLSLKEACKQAKNYTHNFLSSHPSLRGHHVQ